MQRILCCPMHATEPNPGAVLSAAQHGTGCGVHEVTETKDTGCAAAAFAADAVPAAPHRRVLLPGWGVATSSAPEQQRATEARVPSATQLKYVKGA